MSSITHPKQPILIQESGTDDIFIFIKGDTSTLLNQEKGKPGKAHSSSSQLLSFNSCCCLKLAATCQSGSYLEIIYKFNISLFLVNNCDCIECVIQRNRSNKQYVHTNKYTNVDEEELIIYGH